MQMFEERDPRSLHLWQKEFLTMGCNEAQLNLTTS